MNTLTVVWSNRSGIMSRPSVREVFRGFVTPIYIDIHSLPLGYPPRAENPDGGTIKVRHDGWPTAVNRALLTANLDALARDQIFRQHGDAGFIELLSGIAPFLKHQLKVQAFSFTLRDGKASIKAAEWVVRPGDSKVAVTTILPIQE